MTTSPIERRRAPLVRGWWRALPLAALAAGACDPRAAPTPTAVAAPPAPRLTSGPAQAGTRAVVDFAWRTTDARAWLSRGEGRASGAADVEG
ncbi:MAG: hypothetical protein IT376_06300 [Polyangiaceae bacterium]|nr:hypothetical protein [Polyangiaceae bacterium]